MKNVLITGAGGNLGTAVVKRFLKEGYHVIAAVSPGKAPKETMQGLTFVEVDLAQEALVERLIQDLTKGQSIDAALMLAGGYASGAIDKTGKVELSAMYDLNFLTAYNVARPVFQTMMQQGSGTLVFIGARAALDASTGKNMIAYGLSKSLLFKLSSFLGDAGKKSQVKSHVVVPSTIDTPANREAMPNADWSKWVQPAEIAGMLLDLVEGRRSEAVIETR